MRWKRRTPSKTRNTENTPTLHVHGNAKCHLSPLNPRRQLLRPRRQTSKAKRKRNQTKAGIWTPQTPTTDIRRKLLLQSRKSIQHHQKNNGEANDEKKSDRDVPKLLPQKLQRTRQLDLETSMQLWNLQSSEKTRTKRKLKGLHPWVPTL